LAQVDWLGLKVGGRPVLVLRSSDDPAELPQWQRHDDNTIDIVMTIFITTTTITEKWQKVSSAVVNLLTMSSSTV